MDASTRKCCDKDNRTNSQVNSFSHFLAVIFGIGILTGIGEEMIFRGVLQRIVQDKNHRAHVAVWICAFLFSAIHLQFYGFIPRLLLAHSSDIYWYGAKIYGYRYSPTCSITARSRAFPILQMTNPPII